MGFVGLVWVEGPGDVFFSVCKTAKLITIHVWYSILTYMLVIFGVHVGKHTIHREPMGLWESVCYF